MKKKLTIGAIFYSALSFSQVGISTQNPQGTFNIDGGKDNPITGSGHTAAEQLNDFTVLANGNVGLGTIAPTQKLEVQTGGTSSSPVTGFKLVDGNQNNAYVLTSDANGVGTWIPSRLTTYSGTFVADGMGTVSFGQLTGNNWLSTGATLTLGPGKWKVDVVQLLRVSNSVVLTSDDYMWFRFSFADGAIAKGSLMTTISNDLGSNSRYVSGNVNGPKTVAGATRYGLAQGFVFIVNPTSGMKTYTLVGGSSTSSSTDITKTIDNVGGAQWGENVIFAQSSN